MSIERLELLKRQLDGSLTVLNVIAAGALTRTPNGKTVVAGAVAWPIYCNGDATVMMSEYETGATWPNHEHTESIEWIINISGEFVVSIELPDGELKEVLNRGDSIKLPMHTVHSVKCIAAGKLLAACVPPEKGY